MVTEPRNMVIQQALRTRPRHNTIQRCYNVSRYHISKEPKHWTSQIFADGNLEALFAPIKDRVRK